MRENFTQLYVHLVWATWDRSPLITTDIREQLYNVIAYECSQMKCHLYAIGGIEDHIHLLTGFPSTLNISNLVKQIKGSSSHCVSNHIKPSTFFKWQGSYAAFTVGQSDLDHLITYIQNQIEHHRQKTSIPDWEIPVIAAS